MWIVTILSFSLLVPPLFFLVRLILYKTALIFVFRKCYNYLNDKIHVHQLLKVPEFNENGQENQFYRRVSVYLNSLPAIEDSDYVHLFSGKKKTSDVTLTLDDNQVVHDDFFGAKVTWVHKVEKSDGARVCCFLLRVKRKDKRRILRPYLQHIHTVYDDIEQRKKELRLFINTGISPENRWRCFPFISPASFETIAMDSDQKNKLKADLETFVKSQSYYQKLGRAWKRSYLLSGASGTGKSTFIAAMANFLNYDVYDIDVSRISNDSDLKLLLLQTGPRSLIVVENLDKILDFPAKKSPEVGFSPEMGVSLSGLMNFMDGIVNSCCWDEKIMVFTVTSTENIGDVILRPGRIDVKVHFPLCDFNSFKFLANNYLGVKEHKLFSQVEEIFLSGGGAALSPAEIGELMMAHRSSPSRALKSVITALQSKRMSDVTAGAAVSPPQTAAVTEEMGGGGWKETVAVGKEFRKLYGLLRLKSCKKPGSFDHDSDLIER